MKWSGPAGLNDTSPSSQMGFFLCVVISDDNLPALDFCLYLFLYQCCAAEVSTASQTGRFKNKSRFKVDR